MNAARALGYTPVSWDDVSGKEVQPSSSKASWNGLTHDQRVAAVRLGFTGTTWDNKSGKEKQPAPMGKFWAELATCGEEHMRARIRVPCSFEFP